MSYKILDFFSSLEDPRRGQGMRHQLKDILTIVIMAILSGHQGLRGFSRFAKANEQELCEVLGLKHGVPGYSTFRDVLAHLEEQLFAEKFIKWVKTYDSKEADDYIALDGKAIRATTHNGGTELQNFVSVVNAFGHESGLVYGMKAFENKKSHETKALTDLIEQLGLKDKIFTMDALHTKKNT